MTTATGAATASAAGAKKKGAGATDKRPKSSFLTKEKREMRVEYLGEQTPGPGAYLPASTFGKHAAKSPSPTKKPGRVSSSSFASASSQRPPMENTHVPGAGAYTPNKGSIERNKVRRQP
jgi:hypothetical protein